MWMCVCVHVCVECVTDGVGWFLGSRCSGCINGSKREKLLHQIQGQSISNHLLSTGMLLRMQSWGINNKQATQNVCVSYILQIVSLKLTANVHLLRWSLGT